MSAPTPLPAQCDIEVRFRDLDALGHVNSAVYCTYLEQARVHFFARQFPEHSGRDAPPETRYPFILAHQELRYRLPLFLGEVVRVHMAPVHVGTTSLTLHYDLIRVHDEAMVAVGRTTLVWFDHRTGAKAPLPPAARERLVAMVVAHEWSGGRRE